MALEYGWHPPDAGELAFLYTMDEVDKKFDEKLSSF